jgi:hypothetical protein
MSARRRDTGYFGKTGTTIRWSRPRRHLSRRQFLAGTTLTGVALTVPPWLLGCGSDDDHGSAATPVPTATPSPTPDTRQREQRTLHFDFSFTSLHDLRLQALGSQSNQAPILAHTEASRARARQADPALAAVPDERLTHYIEDVDVPADALQHLWVTGSDSDDNAALAVMHIHVPAAARQAAQQRALAATQDGRSAPPRASGVVNGGNDYLTPLSTAVSLVFHNPEIMNLNVDQGATILNLIQTLPCTDEPTCTPYLGTLATMIAEKWPATTSGGWATLVQVTDANGQPIVNGQGQPVYRWDVDPGISQEASAVAAQIKKAIFDDQQFVGTNWHPTQGITVSQTNAPSGLTGGPGGAAQFALGAAYPAGASVHGVAFDSVNVTNQASRTVELQFRNAYLRYLSAYVQFANENGDLPVANPTKEDTSRAKFLSWINSNFTILGIPLFGNDIPQSSVSFDVPADASIAKVYFGSLGLGGEAFCPESLDGSILTLILNLGVPTILLAAGIAMTGALIKALSEQIGVTVVQVIRASLPLILGATVPDIANGIFGTSTSGNAVGVLTSLGNAVISAFFASGEAATFLVELGVAVIAGQAIDCTGPIALIFRAIAVVADVAMIAQTVGEVLASPALFINELCLTQTTTVTISKDPKDFQFPSTARMYEVTLTYDTASKVAHRQCGMIEPGRTEPIVAVFNDVPSGGMVTVDVYLTTDSGCIVGRSTGQDGMTPGPYGPVPGTQASIAFPIKELLIPLLQTTQYLHDVKLEYQNGQHVWVSTSAPTATIANLGQGQENALYDLNGITVSQRTGMVGYAYRAGGQGVPFCGQITSGIAYMVQNLFLADDPDKALKQLPCGFEQVAGIVYDRLGPITGIGRNFFLQPTPQGFYVQSITLDDTTTPINVQNPLSWGVFSQALDSLAVVPTGYVVGVNSMNHQMQILELPPAAVDAAQAPQAVPFAVTKMGLGTRAGLLADPVAVTVIDATILILENGNQRIQAVDVSGNPVLIFQNGTSNIAPLERGTGITYLDLGVEGMGYLYVLSFVNDGMTADDYRLDVYDPQGNFLTRTTGVAAARLAVDTFRNVYTLNYEVVANAPRVEPSLSQWNPSTPGDCPTPAATPSVSCPTAPPTSTPAATRSPTVTP